MTKFTNVIRVELPDESGYKCFTEDGLDVYCVKLNAIGIDHGFWMTVPGESEDDAAHQAMMSIAEMKYNDVSVEEIIKIED